MANCIILAGGTWVPDYTSKIQRGLGPYRIATALETAGYTVQVIDFVIHLTTEEIIQAISKHLGPDTLWVGFSSTFFWNTNQVNPEQSWLDRMYWTDYSNVKPIIDYIKQTSSARLVYGGAKTPFLVGTDKNIDHYVVGYADTAIVELTQSIERKQPAELVIDSTVYPAPKMDSLTTCWHTILPGEGLPIELARGCIFKCKFCSYPLLGKKKGTYLIDTNLVRDQLLANYEQHGTTRYYITDDTFNDDNDKIEALHRVFTDLPFKIQFSCYLRLDLLHKHPHQADLLSDMGLIGTYFGIESLLPESARAIGKGLHPNKVKDRLYWLQERWHQQVNVAAGFILGLPYDTTEYFDSLINWCMEADNPLQHISFYALMFYNKQINDDAREDRLRPYYSEFTLHPEIYGYEFDKDSIMSWSLPSQHLSYDKCLSIADYYNGLVADRNKISDFQLISHLNIGIPLADMYELTQQEINRRYDINQLNQQRLIDYKQLL